MCLKTEGQRSYFEYHRPKTETNLYHRGEQDGYTYIGLYIDEMYIQKMLLTIEDLDK